MTNVPLEHHESATEIDADRIIELFEIRVHGSNEILYLKSGVSRTWQGNEYQEIPCALTGERVSADGEANRPTFSFYNKDNLFGPLIYQGYTEMATLTRRRILQSHLIDDVNLSVPSIFMLGRVISQNKQQVQIQCRTLSDTPNFKLSGLFFTAPEYPFVVYR
jgi:phage-related protein